MQTCSIYDNALRFSRATYGSLVLIAFLIHNHWLILATIVLMIFGIFSIKLNIPYQFHALIVRKLGKDKSEPIEKESEELNFVAAITVGLLFTGFLFLYYGKFVDFAWIFILIVDLLIFLACFVGFCVATLMYIFLKKIFKR